MPIITLRSACAFCCSLLLLVLVATSSQSAESDELLKISFPVINNPALPKVIFNHTKHVNYVDEHGSDCSRCHRVTKQGLSTAAFDVRLQKAGDQVSYLHKACTDCHSKSGQGPALVQCRTCHAEAASHGENNK
ncbi:MAG: cytochrome c3 family protein [Desulfovibrio sp.]|nr:cytochrome c3 family protein [Desulfovibrio sp.]